MFVSCHAGRRQGASRPTKIRAFAAARTAHDRPVPLPPSPANWPTAHPERLQLYSLPTPNGVKVSILLEELGLPYEPHLVSFDRNDQLSPEFLSLNPNNKIPAILDPDGPGGKPLALFDRARSLLYLAEKSGRFLNADPAARYEAIQWLMFQMGGVGPMFGQVGVFHKFAGKDWRTSARAIATWPNRAGCSRCWNSTSRARLDAGRRLQHRRHRDLALGEQPDRLLRRGRAGATASRVRQRGRAWRIDVDLPRADRRCSAG